jgi:23S rRNA pseudouridine2605 synthase
MAYRRPPSREGHVPARGSGPRSHSRPRPGGPARRPQSNVSINPSPPDEPHGPERLQKILAHAGVGSRRACEELILQGRVTVDGRVVRELGTRVDPARAKVAVDGQRIQPERLVYFAVSKPKGYVSTNRDPAGRPRVVDLLPEIPQRVYSIGRLDEMSTGLMLLTNDGELANRLAHPKFGVEKLYRVVVAGTPGREVLDQLTEGIWLAEGKVRAKRVRVVGRMGQATVLEMVLAEGKNREVRRMLARLGHKVMTLTRTAVGPITLRGLQPGEYRPLSAGEVDLLRKVAAGIDVSPARFSERKPPRAPARGRSRPLERAEATGGPRPRTSGGPVAGRPAPRRSGTGGVAAPPPRGPQRAPVPPRAAGPRPAGPPPAPRRPKPPAPRPVEPPPTRQIIGLEPEHGPVGPTGPRPRRPAPKRRSPRAALGMRRRRPDGEQEE